MTSVDTVFNEEMRPVFVGDPDTVLRRLKSSYPESWNKVCVGETQKIVTIPEYLYRETWGEVVGMLEELLRKQDLPMYRRDPSRLEVYLEVTARKIIERVREGM